MSARASLHLTHKTWFNITFENLTIYTQKITFLWPCIKGKNIAHAKLTYLNLCLSHRFCNFQRRHKTIWRRHLKLITKTTTRNANKEFGNKSKCVENQHIFTLLAVFLQIPMNISKLNSRMVFRIFSFLYLPLML